MNRILNRKEIVELRKQLKKENKKVAFTNGCFDIIHSGHIDYLNKAKESADILIVAVNSDESVRKIKGDKRPILNEEERAYILSNLRAVDIVTVFDENTPAEIINELLPDVLVKGEDWSVENIVGADAVIANGGEVKRIKFVNQQSTSKIIERIIKRYAKP